MRSDHAHFRSLNSAIQSVTNPQPKVVKEERAVDDTSFAVERGNKKKKWKISGGGNAVGFDALRAAIERRKIYKSRNSRATVKEEQEYIAMLEFALEAIAEELELDPNELVEAYRLTPARSAVLDREDKKSSRYMKTHGAQGKATDLLRDEDGAMSMKKSSGIDPKKRAKYQNAADRRYRIDRLKSASKEDGGASRFDKKGLDHDRRREQRSRKAI